MTAKVRDGTKYLGLGYQILNNRHISISIIYFNSKYENGLIKKE